MIECTEDIVKEVLRISQERDWPLKKAVEKIVDAYFQNKKV